MRMRAATIRGLAVMSLAVLGTSSATGAPEAPADPYAAFWEAYERGARADALAKLPAEVRDASPYDTKTAALSPYDRDKGLYHRLLERLDRKEAVPATARRDAALHAAVAAIAWKDGDVERARRRWLLALGQDPADRMSHVGIARAYAVLEAAALKDAGDRPLGEVLVEKVGFASSDLHIEIAQSLIDAHPDPEAVTATFPFDAGKVGAVKTTRAKSSANARVQRPRAAAPNARDLCVVLLAADRTRLDEEWFAPVRTLWIDGVDEKGGPAPDRKDLTSFEVSVELLALSPPARVLVFDADGKKIAEAAVAAAQPAK